MRVTANQEAAIKAAADDAGMTVTAFICWRALGDHSRESRGYFGPDIDLLRQILAQIGKRGANLNQIAYHLNSCDFQDLADELLAMRADHAAALAEHRDVCEAIKKALGV